MANIPKYILDLLEKRRELAYKLIDINTQLNEYADKLGVIDMDEACRCSSFMIYTEPDAAKRASLSAFEEALANREQTNHRSNDLER